MALFRHASGWSFEASFRGRVRPGTTTCVGPSSGCGNIPDVGWEQSGGESKPAVTGSVYRLWEGRSAGVRLGRTVESVSWGGCEGRHKAGTYGDLMGLAGRGLARHFRLGTRH